MSICLNSLVSLFKCKPGSRTVVVKFNYMLREFIAFLRLVGWLVFYGISTFVGYLMPNPFLCKWSVLFQTIQISMRTQFNCQKHFYVKLFRLFKQF